MVRALLDGQKAVFGLMEMVLEKHLSPSQFGNY
jgi:hypothetical protein